MLSKFNSDKTYSCNINDNKLTIKNNDNNNIFCLELAVIFDKIDQFINIDHYFLCSIGKIGKDENFDFIINKKTNKYHTIREIEDKISDEIHDLDLLPADGISYYLPCSSKYDFLKINDEYYLFFNLKLINTLAHGDEYYRILLDLYDFSIHSYNKRMN